MGFPLTPTPTFTPGLDCFIPSPGNRQALGGTSFPEELVGGGAEGGRGRGQVWTGDADGVGTRWKICPGQLNSSQSPGSRPRG